ncbi:DNA ligase D [Acidovorax sp. NCPPB 3576]|uniref:DNA ligase D n=1 Tax=Acidovorax sp. NCPPB 3576 TaxID=2940488 RepID=UPI0023493D33|nr:DNA ligase D [Acidovorax sp. NCPPB 3576]WCM90475.1 DNA ligase D [Acidovorax sp. NCPPB 3576]
MARTPTTPAALTLYEQKRDFSITPEPRGGSEARADALRFVIQKHWATRLHYDLRLEMEGTMKSWAVPKGPSFDPADKRMAVQVEDHPIAYNQFEGQIPARQYGAGKVIIWDKGYWVPLEDPVKGYQAGKLKFEIHGHKLQGRWTLVRMHRRGQKEERQPPWLLIKEHDGLERPAAEFNVVEEMPDSVSSLPDPPGVPGQAPLSEKPAPRKARAPKAPQRAKPVKSELPAKLSPQLATLVQGPPPDLADWLFELKFDGYRLLARIDQGQVQLFTRNGNDWVHKMPQLAEALKKLPIDSGWIDGEIVAMDRRGMPDFQALQNAFETGAAAGLVFYAFDLPFLNGADLRALPVTDRREALRAIVPDGEGQRVRFSEAFDAAPGQLIASACRLGFEGVIGKRKSAPYVSHRTADWIKLKCGQRQEFVIGGYTEPRGTRTGIGALLLGVQDDDGSMRYVGNVGTGFNERSLAQLRERLGALTISKSPFANAARGAAKVHWVRPLLLAEVAFASWTHSERIRHAVFRGLRDDKPAKDIVHEHPLPAKARAKAATRAKPSTARADTLRVTHADRVIDPESGTTKIDLVRYYALVAPLMMEHLHQRPVSLVRAPAGVGGELFFQRHQEQGNLQGVQPLKASLYPDHPPLLEVVAPEGLLAAAQMNTVEFHTWNARKDRIDRPDRMTFDLDPGEGLDWERMQEAATLMRVMLTELGLPSFLKTSGGKGLHVVVPIQRRHDWNTVKGFSQAIVQHMARTIPALFVAKSGPRNRVGKVFVDYLRNGLSATTVSAWSARSRPGLGISVPLAWKELEALASSAQWTVRNVDERLRIGNTPWENYSGAAVSIAGAMRLLQYTPKA